MRVGQPRHATDPSRTAQDRTEYMRNYMADRRAKSAQAAHIVRARAASLYDIGRDELRDKSGIKMWPARVLGSETPMSDGDREIAAAEKRRRDAQFGTEPASRKPAPRMKNGPGRRVFERRAV
jgi:hypothetical protein